MNTSAPGHRELKAFLCHGSEDKPIVRELYSRLRQDGVNPWLDETDILPGQDWDMEIRGAVRNSDAILVCLSKSSVGKEGYLQKEIKFALDIADEKPQGTIFIIPIKLNECDMPERLRQWQWIRYPDDDEYGKLIRALRQRAVSLNLTTLPGDGPIERLGKPIEEKSGRLLYKSVHIRELLRLFKNGELSEDDIENHPPSVVVGITPEGLTEALSSFTEETRRAEEKERILKLIGIRFPYDYWQEVNTSIHCFQNQTEQPTEELTIEHIPVVSSNISSIGYNARRRILEIKFRDGSVYQYFEVPAKLHSGLMNASSHGKFLHYYIRGGGFAYRRIV